MRPSINAVSLRRIDSITRASGKATAHIAGWNIPVRDGIYEEGEPVILFAPGTTLHHDRRMLDTGGFRPIASEVGRKIRCFRPAISKLENYPGVCEWMQEDQSSRFDAETTWPNEPVTGASRGARSPEFGGTQPATPNWLFFDRASRNVRDAKNDWEDVWEPYSWEAFSLDAMTAPAFVGIYKGARCIGSSETIYDSKFCRRPATVWARANHVEDRLKEGEFVRVHTEIGGGDVIPTGFWRGGQQIDVANWPAWLREQIPPGRYMRIPEGWGYGDVAELKSPWGGQILLTRITPDDYEPEGYDLHV